MSKIKRLRAVLTGAVTTALAVGMLPVLAVTASAAADPLGGQPGPVTLSPTMPTDTVTPVPPAGTTLDDFYRHPVLALDGDHHAAGHHLPRRRSRRTRSSPTTR